MAKKKNPKVMNLSELESKGTKELLGHLKRLQRCEESSENSDLTENDYLDDDLIYFKNTEKWKIAYSNVKTILNNREHMEK